MTKKEAIKIFEEKKVRAIWDETEAWYFSVIGIIAVLTDSSNPTDYFKKMRKRDEQLASFVGTNCPQVTMLTEIGKKRKTLAADAQTSMHRKKDYNKGFFQVSWLVPLVKDFNVSSDWILLEKGEMFRKP